MKFFSAVTLAILGAVFLIGSSVVEAASQPVWQKVCVDRSNPKSCRITQQLFLKKNVNGEEKIVGKILKLSVVYVLNKKTEKREPHLILQMPLGIDLRVGAALKIDKGKEIPLQFLQCTKAGCDTSLKLDNQLLQSLKAGIDLNVGFKAWGSNQTTVIKASLKGFTRSFSALR